MAFGMQGVMTATSGQGVALGAYMLEAANLVRGVKGCALYVVQLSTTAEDTVLITEVWASEDDHAASLGIPEVRALIGRARPLIAGMTHHKALLLGGVGVGDIL